MVTLSLCVDLISLKIACDFVMNSVHYSKNTSSEIPIFPAQMRIIENVTKITQESLFNFSQKLEKQNANNKWHR